MGRLPAFVLDKMYSVARPIHQVGFLQRSVRSLMGRAAIQRRFPGLARMFCGPESSIFREFIIDYHGFEYRGVTNNAIDWSVYFFENFVLPEAKLVEDARSSIQRKDKSFVCYDIGANIGHRTLIMAKYATRVIATEAFKGANERLCEKLRVNRLRHVDAFQVMIDDDDRDVEVELVCPHNYLIMRRDQSMMRGGYGTHTLQAVRGDAFINNLSLPAPHFMRINAGLGTLNVLRGLGDTLRRERPVTLIDCPRDQFGRALDVDVLRACLYDDVEIRTFEECWLSATYALTPFDHRSGKLVCYPAALDKMAQHDAFDHRQSEARCSSAII